MPGGVKGLRSGVEYHCRAFIRLCRHLFRINQAVVQDDDRSISARFKRDYHDTLMAQWPTFNNDVHSNGFGRPRVLACLVPFVRCRCHGYDKSRRNNNGTRNKIFIIDKQNQVDHGNGLFTVTC